MASSGSESQSPHEVRDGQSIQALAENIEHKRASGWGVADIDTGSCEVVIDSGTLGEGASTLTVQGGVALLDGETVSISAQSVDVGLGDSAYPRKDVVYLDADGTAHCRAGDPEPRDPQGVGLAVSERPAPPALRGEAVLPLAVILVSREASAVSGADVIDVRASADGLYRDLDVLGNLTAGGAAVATEPALASHTGATDNPHGVTASQAGALPTSGGTVDGDLTVDGDTTTDSLFVNDTIRQPRSVELVVDPVNGTDANDGLTADTALETLHAAINRANRMPISIIYIRILNTSESGTHAVLDENVEVYGKMIILRGEGYGDEQAFVDWNSWVQLRHAAFYLYDDKEESGINVYVNASHMFHYSNGINFVLSGGYYDTKIFPQVDDWAMFYSEYRARIGFNCYASGHRTVIDASGVSGAQLHDWSQNYADLRYKPGNEDSITNVDTTTGVVGLNDLSSHLTDDSNPHQVTAAQAGAPAQSDFDTHTGDTSNPHSVTAQQVGAYSTSEADSTFVAATGDYEIQKNGTDGTGVINFVTE